MSQNCSQFHLKTGMNASSQFIDPTEHSDQLDEMHAAHVAHWIVDSISPIVFKIWCSKNLFDNQILNQPYTIIG